MERDAADPIGVLAQLSDGAAVGDVPESDAMIVAAGGGRSARWG